MSSVTEDSQVLIVKNRSTKISDGNFIPKEFKKYDDLVKSIVNINKCNVMHVFERIKPVFFNTAYKIIEHAIKIRPLQAENLLSLFALLIEKVYIKKQFQDIAFEWLIICSKI